MSKRLIRKEIYQILREFGIDWDKLKESGLQSLLKELSAKEPTPQLKKNPKEYYSNDGNVRVWRQGD